MAMQKKNNGFTLVELLIVLSFIGVFVAMTINFSMRNKDRWSLRDTARTLTSVFYQAKQRASRENASVRLDVGLEKFTMYWEKTAGNWEELKSEPFPEKINVSATDNFLISPSGFILNPDNTLSNTRTITLTAPRGAGVDTMTITIYPYGGLRVEKVFQ